MTVPDHTEVALWRRSVGKGARLWARHGVELTPHGWRAFSGAPLPDYNVIAVHDGAGADDLSEGIERLTELRAPGLVMLGGSGLALAPELADRSWVCITATPIMAMAPEDHVGSVSGDEGLLCRPVADAERSQALALIADAFGLPDGLERWALPDAPDAVDHDLLGLWDGDEMVTAAASVPTDEGAAVWWSMATPAARQRRGYGTALMHQLAERHIQAGGSTFAMLASPPGIKAYLSLGFRIVEHWQVWSRPRWVLGR